MTQLPPRFSLLLVVCAMSSVAPLAMHIIMPSLPGLQSVFDADYGTVQLSLTLYMVAFAVSQLVVGSLSDRYGRRPVVLGGLTVFLVGSLVCMLATTIPMLVMGRVLQAAGGCAGFALARSIIRDLYDRDQAASMIAYLTMILAISPMIGPMVGGYLDVWFGWRSIFAFVLAVGIVVTAAVLMLLRETHVNRGAVSSARDMLASFSVLLRRRDFLGFALSTGFLVASWFSFLGAAPYVVVTLMGRPPSEYGVSFLFIAGSYLIGNMIAGRISQRVGIHRMIAIGTPLVLFGALIQAGLVLYGVLTPVSFFGPMLIMGIGYGFAMPNAVAGSVSVDPSRAGAAAGLVGFMQMGIGAAMAFIVGHMLGDSAVPLVLTMVSLIVLSGVVYLWGARVDQ